MKIRGTLDFGLLERGAGRTMIPGLLRMVLVAVLVTVVSACWTQTRPPSIPGYAERGIRLIAVMPVKTRDVDAKFTRLMREKALEALYFKGYPKVPLETIDAKLAEKYNQMPKAGVDVPPQVVRSLLNVDAVLYMTANECKTDMTWLYAVTTVSVDFELRSGKTGETLWQARTRSVKRSFDITRQRLEQDVSQMLEPAIQAVVDKALLNLPEGQDAV